MDSLLRSPIGSATSLKQAPISGDDVTEGSLAFNSKNAANFKELHCSLRSV